jgi:protocadherin delta 1
MSSTAVLDVVVDDVNDNRPRMSQDRYVVQITENNFRSALLGQLSASDPDEGPSGVVAFRLEPLDADEAGDVMSAVSVDPTSGMISANVAFDFERRQKYSYRVVATDAGSPPLSSTAELVVIVLDANDERPEFTSANFNFQTVENLPVGTVVGHVTAVDGDVTPDFRRVSYHLVDSPNNAAEFLAVDLLTGDIRTIRNLDREETPVLTARVYASDDSDIPPEVVGGSSSYCDVIIEVADENDNDPMITYPPDANRTIYVSESQLQTLGESGGGASKIVRVEAVDPDEGPDANLTYFFADNAAGGVQAGLFSIDPSTGWILMASPSRLRRHGINDDPETDESWQLSQESTDGSGRRVELTVGVKDNGSPPRTAYGRLTVHVTGWTTDYARSPPAVVVRPSPLTSWFSRLMLVLGSAVAVATVTAVAFTIVIRHRCVKWQRSYNCRLREANVIVANSAAAAGSRHSSYSSSSAATDRKPPSKANSSSRTATSTKKGVTFNLKADVDELGAGGGEGLTSISSPLQDGGRFCTIPECALHRLPPVVTASKAPATFDDKRRFSPYSANFGPVSGRRHELNPPRHLHGSPCPTCTSSASSPPLRYNRLPCRIGQSGVGECGRLVFVHHSSPKSLSYEPGREVDHPCSPETTSPSYSVGRCSTFSFSRSQGSLTDSGQGHSDPDDVIPSPYGRTHFTFSTLPSESAV